MTSNFDQFCRGYVLILISTGIVRHSWSYFGSNAQARIDFLPKTRPPVSQLEASFLAGKKLKYLPFSINCDLSSLVPSI